MCVCLSVCVDSSAIETTFPLSNFKTKHIFGILMSLMKFQDHLGHRRRPKLFLFIFYRRGRHPNFFFYLAEMPPNAAFALEGKGNVAEGGCFASISKTFTWM